MIKKKAVLFCKCVLFCLLLLGCKKEKAPSKGELLARNYCASCHLFPGPELLPKDVWMTKTIPEMGLRLGMSHHGPEYYDSGFNKAIYPENMMLSQEEWESLVMYYKIMAPQEIPVYKQEKLEESDGFETMAYAYNGELSSIVTMVEYNAKDEKLYLGDGKKASLVTLNVDGNVLNVEKLKSPPVKIQFEDNSISMLLIGSLYPSDEKKGVLNVGDRKIDSLIRPVDFIIKDVDKDGFKDVLVSEFGNTIGNLVWYKNNANTSYSRHVIHPFSGSIKMEYADIDNDGKEEFLAMFAQESESIIVFSFEEDKFSSRKIKQFHPAFGLNDFQLVDFNNDDLLDIVVSNGDNADYSSVLKNYHGIRVYLNNGDFKFTESYFYPYHGASKVEVADFNLDGKLDILTISNFGDLTDSNFESVVLLTNTGDLNFNANKIKNIPRIGWQTIDVKDFDNDGDKDVFIGAFGIKLGPKESIKANDANVSWIRLINKTKN